MQLRAQAQDTQGAGQASFRGYISVVTAVLGVGRGVRWGAGGEEPRSHLLDRNKARCTPSRCKGLLPRGKSAFLDLGQISHVSTSSSTDFWGEPPHLAR